MGSGGIWHLHAPYQTGAGRESENQCEETQKHEHAHNDDPTLLQFAIDRRLRSGPSADLITTVGAELGVIPDLGSAVRAPAVLTLITKSFEVFRAGAEIVHSDYSGYAPRLMKE